MSSAASAFSMSAPRNGHDQLPVNGAGEPSSGWPLDGHYILPAGRAKVKAEGSLDQGPAYLTRRRLSGLQRRLTFDAPEDWLLPMLGLPEYSRLDAPLKS